MKSSAVLAVELLARHPEGMTRLDAIRGGCGNLPARVAEARAEGWVIRDEWVTTANGARIKSWHLVRGPRRVDTGTQIGLALA